MSLTKIHILWQEKLDHYISVKDNNKIMPFRATKTICELKISTKLQFNSGALMLSSVLHISVMQIPFALKSRRGYNPLLSVDMNIFYSSYA